MDERSATDRSSPDCWSAPHFVAHITAAITEVTADTEDMEDIILGDTVATGKQFNPIDTNWMKQDSIVHIPTEAITTDETAGKFLR